MTKPRSKDPLLAAITGILLPTLKPYGFRRKGTRQLIRITDGILQSVFPWYSGWGGRDFYFSYSIMPLVPPSDFAYEAAAERLRDAARRQLWPGQTHELAAESMQQIVQMLPESVMPLFTSTETVEGFLTLLQQRSSPDPHRLFWMACCLTRLHRLDKAKKRLLEAMDGYKAVVYGRDWALARADLCEQLLLSIDHGTSSELLEQWKLQTIRNLKLEKFV
jgi:hypothetical protein